MQLHMLFARRLGAAFFFTPSYRSSAARQFTPWSPPSAEQPSGGLRGASPVHLGPLGVLGIPSLCTRVRYTAGYTIVQPGYSGLVRAEVLGQTFCALRAAFWDLAPLLRGVVEPLR